jgi:hypothetical protein
MKKNMITLKGDLMYGEGSIKVSSCFNEQDGLMKADLLKDWVHQLNDMYDEAIHQWRDEMKTLKSKFEKEKIK